MLTCDRHNVMRAVLSPCAPTDAAGCGFDLRLAFTGRSPCATEGHTASVAVGTKNLAHVILDAQLHILKWEAERCMSSNNPLFIYDSEELSGVDGE